MAINNIITESWQGHSHGEVEDALKAALLKLAQDIENYTIQPNSVTAAMLSADVRDVIVNAVPNFRTINGKSLAGNITLKTSDIQNDSGYITQDDLPESATPDNAMSGDSENAVQNKVIKDYVDAAVSAVSDALTNLIGSGYVFGPIKTFSDVISFLNGINNSETLAQKLMLKADVLDVYAKSETYNRSQVYNKGEVDDAIADAVDGLGSGTVESITINGETKEPDEHGNVNLGANPAPYIDIPTGHWFIGDEDTGVNAQGPQGNSGYTGAAGELEVVNNYTEGGAAKALSAEAGKDLATQCLPGYGSFAEADEKAFANNVVFPWMLNDTDRDGNKITKMVWHIGNREFVDAIGAKVNGRRNGITIISDGDGILKVYGGGYEANPGGNAVKGIGDPGELHFSAGETNFRAEDIVTALRTANQTLYETAVSYLASPPQNPQQKLVDIYTAMTTFDGTKLRQGFQYDAYSKAGWEPVTIEADATNGHAATWVDIDMVGIEIEGSLIYGNLNNSGRLIERLFDNNALIRNVTGMRFVNCRSLSALKGLSNGGRVEVSGEIAGDSLNVLENFGGHTAELSGLEVSGVTSFLGIIGGSTGNDYITKLDIRGIDTSNATTLKILRAARALKTLIVGNFSNASLQSLPVELLQSVTGCTLVCTTDTPPDFNTQYDWVNGHFSSIKVPSKTIEVNGEEVTVESLYKGHVSNIGDTVGTSGWSKYASIISTYNAGEY